MDTQLIPALILVTVALVYGDHVRISREASACEGKTVTLDCTDLVTPQTIEITSALYQRQDMTTCVTGSPGPSWVTCSADVSLGLMILCGGQTDCTFIADDATLGQDPCPGTPKYLNVTYDCVEDHIPCTELPDECYHCCYFSPCSKSCGHGIAEAVFACVDRTTQQFLYPSLCTIECCLEPCGLPGSRPGRPGHCYEHYPHVEIECDNRTIIYPPGPQPI